jgi:heme/copper-type cytochrome/quinol oxidase subunit 4
MTEQLEQRRGLVAIIVLAVLTAIEYVIAVGIDSTSTVVTLLSMIGIAKAVIILVYFMHLPVVWRGEEDHA